MLRRLAILAFALAAALAVPTVVAAQEMEEDDTDLLYPMEETGWKEHRFHVAAYGGSISGGTNVGFAENLFFQVGFEQGSDTAYGGRVGWVFLARFDVELEFGTASPGLDAVIRDLDGQGRTVAPFADLDLTWIAGSVNYSVIERTRRVVPYLTFGIGAMSVSSEQEPSIDSTEPLLLYGAGLRVRITDPLLVRLDARGLRSGLGSKQVDPTRPSVLVGEFNGTNLLWTAGLEFRF